MKNIEITELKREQILIVVAVVLLLIFLFLMPLAQYIPMACLAGVLVVVSYNMSEWRTIRGMMKNPKADIAVLFTTCQAGHFRGAARAAAVDEILAFAASIHAARDGNYRHLGHPQRNRPR